VNDFTQNELEQLISWGNVYTDFGRSWTNKLNRPLIEKIQSMIENYCEHELDNPLLALVKECKKCNISLAHKRWELI